MYYVVLYIMIVFEKRFIKTLITTLSLSLSKKKKKKTILKRETKRSSYKNITKMDNIEKQAQNYGKRFTSSFLCKDKLFNTLKQYFLSHK